MPSGSTAMSGGATACHGLSTTRSPSARHAASNGRVSSGTSSSADATRTWSVGCCDAQRRLAASKAATVVIVNWLYNYGPRLSSNYAPLDLFAPCGYMLCIPLSCWLNELPYPPHRSWMHCIFLVLRSQLWISTFDIDTDRASGRRNTAVRLGLRGAQMLLATLLLAETVYVLATFDDWALQSFSIASTLLLAAQVTVDARRGAKPDGKATASGLSPESVNATFAVLGLGGVGLMAQVWVNEAFR